MAYPPKLEQLCRDLQNYVNSNFKVGDKIPAEPELSKVMHCSSRTLGTALRKLADRGIVERNNKGTFVKNSAPQISDDEPLIVLLPCSNFESIAAPASRIATRYLIDAAVHVAMKYKKRVITIPVTDSNKKADVNTKGLENLNSNSMIMFSSCWYKSLFPLFEQKNCRLAFFNAGKYEKTNIPAVTNCYKLCIGEASCMFLTQGLNYLKQRGAKNILCAICSKSIAFSNIEDIFDEHLQSAGLNGRLYVWGPDKYFAEWIAELAQIYKKEKFDGLLLSPDPGQLCDEEMDFYKYLKMPESVPFLLTESTLLKQKSIAKNAKLMHLPLYECYLDGAEFLLSGQKGNVKFHAEYQILDIN